MSGEGTADPDPARLTHAARLIAGRLSFPLRSGAMA
jgi:hypothetical protein